MTDLGAGCAYGINDSGQIVGETSLGNGSEHAALWQNGAMSDLGTLGGTYSKACGINDCGQVVGDSYLPNGSDHAFIWQDGQMTDLGALPGGNWSQAFGVSNNGWIIGMSSDNMYSTNPVLWIPVPEPSSIIVVLMGIGGLGGMIWKRKSE